MNNYNSSSYYRANPYKQIGYMPPMAQKNRRSPDHSGQIPQGEQYFEPSAKKHYGYSYHNQIENDKLFRGSGQMSPLQKQAMQRSYFRSLNSQDIEGSSTNTLISKAVKNKMKAQQQLQRRKDIEKQQEEAQKIYQYQQEQKRKKYIEDYHRQVMQERSQKQDQASPSQSPNHQSQLNQKKKRQAELLKLAQQRKNYAVASFPQQQNNQEPRQINNNSAIIQSQPNFHHKQLQKRRKTQRETQTQNSKNHQGYQHENKYINQQIESRYEDKNNIRREQPNDYYRDSLENAKNREMPPSNKPTYNIYEQYQSQPYPPQQKPDSRDYYKNDYHKIEKDEIRKYEDYSLPYENINPVTQMQRKEDSKHKLSQEEAIRNPSNYPNQPNSYDVRSDQRGPTSQHSNTNPYAPVYGSPQPFKSREDLRRHNPTFLSYGSPTFALASRNVIGS